MIYTYSRFKEASIVYFVEKIQAQGERQRKIPLLKRFWDEFPLDSYVRVELIENSSVYFVDFVLKQGSLQRKIPVPQKFWKEFSVGAMVKVSLVKRGDER
ncbi:hypothetical protein HOI26_00075 [Candidatus Woesearchaeota archaeon]|nr:hypothetical protein [Candidatus Woesearchaeota archaeon]